MDTKRCKKCGLVKLLDEFCIEKRNADGYSGVCKKCKAAYDREYYIIHREEKCARSRQWSADNPEYQKQWARANPEKCAKYKRQWRADNPEHCRQYFRQYYAEHIEKYREHQKRRYREHPQKYAEQKRRRRARKAKTVDNLTTEQTTGILARGCWFCDATEGLALAHDIPISGGGNTTAGNTFCLCRSCNAKMATKSLSETIQQLRLAI